MADSCASELTVPAASQHSHACINYIRQIVDRIKLPPADPSLPLIPLSIGDPTLFGNLPPPPGVSAELALVVADGRSNGYSNSMGSPAARAAVARSVSTAAHPVTAEDVCVTSGCSHALLLAMDVLCDAGSNILVPSPGFSLYRTLGQYLAVDVRLYRLDPARNWEVDLAHLESLADSNTRAILLNNPSNPCGTNYSREHLLAVLELAERLKLPIISDEVYAGMVFGGEVFHSLSVLSERVPILLCGGLAKRYMVPGWRVGWLVLCDRQGLLVRHSFVLVVLLVSESLQARGKIGEGVQRLSQTILGASSLVQAVVPHLLEHTPLAYHDYNCRVLEENAKCFVESLASAAGLSVVAPRAAMYCMVGIDLSLFPSFPSEVEFSQALLHEQQVFVLPGSCFTMPSYFRVVLCAPVATLKDAAKRICVFAAKHATPPRTVAASPTN